jgi:tetratricopeptide (TPR) repeat protein
MDILDLPDDLKQRLRDGIVDFLAHQAEKAFGGDKLARIIRQLSSQATFSNSFDHAMESAVKRFIAEYTPVDEDLVESIISDGTFWQARDVREALMTMVNRPGSWLVDERETVMQHFADVLPKRINRERVDKAIAFFLRCVLEELWTLPGVGEIREIYSLQFQKIGAEAARQQVALLAAQLQATTQLSADVRQALLQLATTLEQRLLITPPRQHALPAARPYHNLPQPDYTRFVGRHKELDWLRQHLLTGDRAWQMVIAGIGGVGKSALALAVAHDYRERYDVLPPEERFEAIIWITAKEELLTINGREKSSLRGLIFRTLEDMYTTIAQTLEREDITRAIPEKQDHLVQKALSAQRTLLIVDNLENVTDRRVQTFLYNLPVSTKCIITSREWVDVAAVLKLTGLPLEEAEKMSSEEAMTRGVDIGAMQRQRLFERTSGLPLPIKLSVARMASGETFDQVLRWLGNATGDLPEYCIKGQIAMAHQHDANAWKLLLASSLFDQDARASREALGFTADLSMADRDDGLTVLQRLSLLNRDEDDRFWLLPMVQGYAGAELVRAGCGDALTEQWLAWLLKFVQHNGINLDLHVEKAQMIGLEYPHLLSAMRWCREHERWEMVLQLAEGTWFYLYLVGLFGELREILQAALQAARTLGAERQEGQFLRRLGVSFWVQEQYDTALVKYFEKANEIAIQYKDDVELGRVSHSRSDILYKKGYLREAEKLVENMLETGEQHNYPKLKALAAYRLSEFESKKQRFDKALAWLDQSEKWSRELGWSRGLAWILYRRGITLIQQGNISSAEPFLMESLNMATSWNERHLIAYDKYRLAQVYLNINRFQLARQMAEEARDLYERLGMIERLAEVEELLQAFLAKNAN